MKKNTLSDRLLAYYDAHARILPFRVHPVPYHIWISEIMLQQTRMDTVLPYFERFIKKLPSVADLALVDDEVLMKLWEGLGYYSRARNLKRAAQAMMERNHGVLPQTARELEKLPGIGPYTAGAIASIAFGEPVPAIDGNVIRVFSRLYAYDGPTHNVKGKAHLQQLVAQVMPKDRPGDFNQAIMDLGSAICLPNGAPRCEVCPLKTDCLAVQKGNPLDYPVLAPKKQRRIEEWTVLLLLGHDEEGNEAIILETRPPKGLLAGLNQFPMLLGHCTEKQLRDWLKDQGLVATHACPLPPSRHQFSHVEWRMQGYLVVLSSQGTPLEGRSLLTKTQWRTVALPTAFRAYRSALDARWGF
ncbi:A/G-specific adenine glycosylase [Clostridiaceae bacterium JG1575]|nr:A/G-specific adenine glycosylase [Clostridiaceae bacterium JG1575]